MPLISLCLMLVPYGSEFTQVRQNLSGRITQLSTQINCETHPDWFAQNHPKWVWVKMKPPADRGFGSVFPLTRFHFGYRSLTHSQVFVTSQTGGTSAMSPRILEASPRAWCIRRIREPRPARMEPPRIGHPKRSLLGFLEGVCRWHDKRLHK